MHQKNLLIIFKGIAGDLIFWVFMDTLFLSLAKGLSPQEISLVFSASLWVSLCCKLPAYYIIKRLTQRQAVLLSAVLFLVSSVIITFAYSLVLLIIGQSLYYLARDFYDISDIMLKNVCDRETTGRNFVQCKSASSSIYAAITLIAAIFLEWLISINVQLPMYICIAFRVFSLVIAMFLKGVTDYQENSEKIYLPRSSHWYYSRATVCFLIASVLFQAYIIQGNPNLRLILQTNLLDSFTEDFAVRVVSFCIIGTRIAKLLGDLLMSLHKKEHTDYEKLADILSALLFIVPVLGFLGCRAVGLSSAILIGSGLIFLNFIYDPLNDIQSYLLSRNLNNDQLTALLTVKGTVIRLLSALLSTVMTIMIGKSSFRWIMLPFGLIAAVILIATVAGSYYYRRRHIDYKMLWGDQLLDTDSMIVSVAILVLQYDAAKPEKVSPRRIAAKVQDITEIGLLFKRFRFSEYSEYDYDYMYQCYLTRKPIAVRACIDDQWAWYPVLYMDRGDAVIFNPHSDTVFLKDFEKVGKICIFATK